MNREQSSGTGSKGLYPNPGCALSEPDRKNGKKVHWHLIQCVPSRAHDTCIRCRCTAKVSALFLKIWCQSPGCGSKQALIPLKTEGRNSLGTGLSVQFPYPGSELPEISRKNGNKVHRHLIQCVPSRSRRSSCTESIGAACSLRCRPVSGAGVPRPI